MAKPDLTPRQIVEELDKYIVGQKAAKRAVAIALRNRMRRARLSPELQEEVTPKNILMIGPTGVGKTEIARRLSKLVGAPFIKVEATKFTEVGYVGRDVESMVRDLVETGIRMVKAEHSERVRAQATEHAEERIVAALVPDPNSRRGMKNPFEMLFGGGMQQATDSPSESVLAERRRVAKQLAMGELEDRLVEIEVEEQTPGMLGFLPGMGPEGMGNLQEALGNLLPKQMKRRKMTVREARKVLTQEEAQKLIDMDAVTAEAIYRVENHGIIFIDEMDKIAGREFRGPDVSREGVQRDILPIVEGTTVVTKYGPVRTDHILFIGAGAFHVAKPSDLIPELQGRFPIRVELESLTTEDFERILREPQHALLKQYTALLETEGVRVRFTDEAIRRIAEMAVQVNRDTEDIGARRLHTLVEKVLEDLSFEAPDVHLDEVVITPAYVDEKLQSIVVNRDLSQFIL
ncbi:ATP-dependent protease ATPase subunit HslU [Alicyclobacillus macrosporangiidus]|jgi:ATP-dependent HslUV protease ATP-binding subunit HslU|uniref:ATP-dependent protease ATPase subunit HslU n=1 Tax=Alicyclobacillus macrosporangiidus TaxID=392015 RepID=A0A1I7IQ18_9BACL|nr:ATP-dependent protease ATPase subunit HslU [Alicyclobacillus macrosporangiidus]SFU75023.1 ATP-dependent HslUV protease ATP-binding subunit HslU [Alicyclobacillus macrosporangiidus]